MKNNFNRENLINSISDGSVNTNEIESILQEMPDSNFENFNDKIAPIETNENKWHENYFLEQLSTLNRREFSKKRAEHILKVKKYLQDNNIEGFRIDDTVSENISNERGVVGKRIIEDNLEENNDDFLLDSDNLLSKYIPANDLEQAIQQKYYQEIQLILDSNLNNYRMLITDIVKNILYVYKTLPEAFEGYKVDEITPAIQEIQEEWDTDYFYLQQSYLNHNFSMERLMHLINVREYFAQQGVEGFEQIKVQPTPQTQANPKSKIKPHPNHTSSNSAHRNNSDSDRSHSNNRQSSQRKQEDGFIKTAMKIGGAVLEHIRALIAKLR